MLWTAQVVMSAPAIIWPSTPMFHSPAAKVTSMPAEQSSKGTIDTTISPSLSVLPKAPRGQIAECLDRVCSRHGQDQRSKDDCKQQRRHSQRYPGQIVANSLAPTSDQVAQLFAGDL